MTTPVLFFLKTKKGWVLVDWSAGHSDVVYIEWVELYGVKSNLFGLLKE